jgi:hypothetical protein
MVLRIPRPIGLTVLVYALFSAGVGASANVARADDCLAAPNSPTPQGSHWYYRMDWAKQRKCWYLRAPDQPAQQAVPEAAPRMGATADSPGPQRSPEESGAAISQVVAPPANIPQPGMQTPASAAAAGAAWPDPPPAIAAPVATNAVAVSDDAGAGSPARRADPRSSEDSDSVVGRATSTATAAAPQSVTASPVEMLLALALGLAAAGILSRVVMKFAATRREPTITKYAEPDWIDDTRLQFEFPGDPSEDYPSEGDRSEPEFTEQRQFDPSTDWPIERSPIERSPVERSPVERTPVASSPRQNLPFAPPLRPSIEDLETTERVIMRVLQRARA